MRFDGDGNVLGVFELPVRRSFGAQAIAAPDGSVYLVRVPLSLADADGYYAIEAPVAERLEPDGRSAWILPLPGTTDIRGRDGLDVDQEGNLVVASRLDEDALAEFQVISADGQRAGRASSLRLRTQMG